MNYIIIGLLIISIILNIINLIKKKDKNSNDTIERLGKLEIDLTKELGEFKFNFSRTINEDFNKLNEVIINRLNNINDKVNPNITIPTPSIKTEGLFVEVSKISFCSLTVSLTIVSFLPKLVTLTFNRSNPSITAIAGIMMYALCTAAITNGKIVCDNDIEAFTRAFILAGFSGNFSVNKG